MLFPAILTIILLVYGYVNLIYENKLAAPFLAIVFLYLIWKLYNMNWKMEEQDKKLDEIKNLLEKSQNKETEDKDNN